MLLLLLLAVPLKLSSECRICVAAPELLTTELLRCSSWAASRGSSGSRPACVCVLRSAAVSGGSCSGSTRRGYASSANASSVFVTWLGLGLGLALALGLGLALAFALGLGLGFGLGLGLA